MPLYAFLLCEGFSHTQNRKRYCLRLAFFAMLSEPAFDLAISGRLIDWGTQNVFFTLLLGLLALCSFEKKTTLALPVALCAALVAELMRTDYGFAGVWLILMMGRAGRNRRRIAAGMVVFCLWFTLPPIIDALANGAWEQLPMALVQWFGMAAIWPICHYNGERGVLPRWGGLLLYFYYPLHLLVISVL